MPLSAIIIDNLFADVPVDAKIAALVVNLITHRPQAVKAILFISTCGKSKSVV
jgi:hypothetical protein